MLKKLLQFSSIFILAVMLMSPLGVLAQGLPEGDGTVLSDTDRKIGDECASDIQCKSNSCAASTTKYTKEGKSTTLRVCACKNDKSCEVNYGTKSGTETWTCLKVTKKQTFSRGLPYCHSNKRGSKMPISEELLEKLGVLTAEAEAKNKKAQEQPKTEPPTVATAPKLAVPIPGVNLKDYAYLENKAQVLPWISHYIGGAYRYASTFSMVFAVIMMMLGGVLYIASGVSSSLREKGKAMMTGSVMGFVIIMSSFLVLNLINPELTKLKLLEIENVEFDDVLEGHEEHGKTAGKTCPTFNVPNEKDPTGCKKPLGKKSGIPLVHYNFMNKIDCNTQKRSRNPSSPSIAVIHDGGSTSGIVNYWKSKCKSSCKCYSTHFSIDKDGSIYQIIGLERVAIHAGSLNSKSIGIDLQPNISTIYHAGNIGKCVQRCKDGKKKRYRNCGTKALAIARCSGGFTENQYSSLSYLLGSLAVKTNIQYNNKSIVPHCATHHSDPRGFKWDKISLSKTAALSGKRANRACRFYPDFENIVKKKADKIFGN